MKRIVVLGAGFAGLIAAVGAARKLAELGVAKSEVAVTLVNRDPWHAIRVRNYEADLGDVRVPLDDVLRPIGVDLEIAQVTGIDYARRAVLCLTDAGPMTLNFDRLVFALGSELVRPAIPGSLNTPSTSTPMMRRRVCRLSSPRCPPGRRRPGVSRRWWSAAG